MTHAAYVLTAWALVVGVGAAYAFAVVRRGRSLSARVVPERRRWLGAAPDSTEGDTS